ncbi:hypothetical protein [Cupriavidus sp. AU9028]|uniref:hypothetical protein n=1 Tax=Cupriavidus sp. AU9028 TaxID=2871157 RepID=UPI001C95223E|nr:hypothetical protein [Cupriavidus sp. AU9028]MBY4897124.1 hypothetical protein [Cupriavidus sp. AU9028]
MSASATVLMLLAACCLALALVQAAEWRRPLLLALSVAIGGALAASGELASQTSMASLLHWASEPARRLDLAALLLAEALLFGAHAVRTAQGEAGLAWRLLGLLPPPSLLLSLFLALVGLMLTVDGIDFAVLSWLFALASAAGFAVGAWWLRWALPDAALRGALRVGLHGVQAAAGLWLARPPFPPAVDPVPWFGDRLAVTGAAIALLAVVGWVRQRRQGTLGR